MGTIIRITGDGVFIESNPKIHSMESSSSNILNNKMCNLVNNVDKGINENEIQKHAVDCTNFVEPQMIRTQSSEMSVRGQCYIECLGYNILMNSSFRRITEERKSKKGKQ